VSTRKLVYWVTMLAIFVMAARVSMDTDTWWHLRAGQWIVDHHAVPQVDPFSYTRYGQPWRYPGWLVEAPMYLIFRALGPGGLNLWTAFMVTVTFAVLWGGLSGGPFLRAFALVFAAVVSAVYWAARPYLVTFLLAAVSLRLLEDWRAGRRDRLIWLPVLMVVWANSHGGFAVGFILWGVYFTAALLRWVSKREEGGRPAVRRLALIGLLMVLAVCLNPSGPVMLLYPFKTVGIESLRDYIQEWQSPNFHDRAVQPFAWALLALFGALGFSRRQISREEFLLSTGFTYLSLIAARNVALFALIFPLVLTRHLAPTLARWEDRLKLDATPSRLQRLNRVLIGLLVVAAMGKAALVWPLEVNERVWRDMLPVDAVAFLRERRPPGRLFNAYDWGGYLVWALPEYPVFVDGRTDLYGDEIISQWLQVVRAEPGWEDVLDRWGVNLVLIRPSRPLVRVLEAEGWKQLYSDDVAVVYGRQ